MKDTIKNLTNHHHWKFFGKIRYPESEKFFE